MSESILASGPWVKGMFVGFDAHEIPLDGLAEAANVDIEEGMAKVPLWWEQVDGVGVRDLFAVGEYVYGVRGGQVGVFRPDGSFQSFGVVASAVDWCLDAGVVYFCTDVSVYRVVGEQVEELVHTVLPQDDEFVYEPLGGGQFIAMWQGRLCVVDGSVVKMSQPFRFGTYSPLTDILAFDAPVIWMRSLSGSLWIAFAEELVVILGQSVESAQVIHHYIASAPGMALVTPLPLPNGTVQNCVVFFTQYGFTLGLPSGEVFYPQFERVKNVPLYAGKLSRIGNRLFAFVHGG